jgi:hypothetical protein
VETSKISTNLDLWRLHDELTIVQAAILICDCEKIDLYSQVEGWPDDKKPPGYLAIKMALIKAVERNEIEGSFGCKIDEIYNEYQGFIQVQGPLDPENSKVNVESLRKWLNQKGITGFFQPEVKSDIPDYLDNKHKHYAPKLAAAIGAWEAVNKNPQLLRGKSAKQAMINWLEKNAEQFGLTNEEGKLNELGIEEVAKVANWQKGGAPKSSL